MTAESPRRRRTPAERDVVVAGAALVSVATAFRTWALHGAWWFFDDFYFIQRALSHAPTPGYLMTPYNGHLMPGGVLLTWVDARAEPLDFHWAAAEMVLLFAVAGAGMLRLLVRLFGARWSVLVPLTLFCFSPILLPATIWWAAAVNQLPMLVALVFALDAFVVYLRAPTRRHLMANVAWLVLGLCFVERTLLGFGLLWLLALSYFTTGTLPERFGDIWQRYRPAVLAHTVLVAAYVAVYVTHALNFDARTMIKRPFFEVVHDLAVTAFSAGFVGGPLHWKVAQVTQSEADPPQLVLLVGWATIIVLLVAAARTRRRALRAALLPAFVLAANIGLISVSRAIYFGPEIALDYRFQTEAALASALAIGLAFLPLRDGVESSEPVATGWRIDTRGWAVWGCAVFVCLATVSTSRFPLRNLTTSPRTYLDNVARASREHPHAQLLNLQTPPWIWAPLAYPTNDYRHMFAALHTNLRIRDATTDVTYLVDDAGHLRFLAFTSARALLPPMDATAGCPRVVPDGRSTWTLDGPVFGIGWHALVGYDAPHRQRITLSAGGFTHPVTLRSGRHQFLVAVPGQFTDLHVHQPAGASDFCLMSLEIGQISAGRRVPGR